MVTVVGHLEANSANRRQVPHIVGVANGSKSHLFSIYKEGQRPRSAYQY